MPSDIKQESLQIQVPKPLSKTPPSGTHEIEPSYRNDNAIMVSDIKRDAPLESSNIMERARAAIASAERASAAAHAAANLVSLKFDFPLRLEEGKTL